jgi:tetratricopeptide (TPR) repeat protein
MGERLLTEGRVVLGYLRWNLFPTLRQFGLYHDDIAISRGWWNPPSTVFAFVALASLAGIAFALRRQRPLVALGIAWFFAAQLLTATIVPLELVFEHRNYFASLGACIVVADLLLLAPRGDSPRRMAALVAVLWLSFLGMTTLLRAKEWSDPLRFAASEAAKHPASPRATYDHARLLALATGYKGGSPYLPQALAALERARAVPNSGLLPASALLILAARTGTPLQDAWWNDLAKRQDHRRLGAQDVGAIAAITRCARDGDCAFPPDAMLAMFKAALDAGGRRAEVMNIEADYVLNVLHQPDTALYLWRRAIELNPGEPQYRINLTKALIALGRQADARKEIDALRRMNLPGTNEAAARALEARMQRARPRPAREQGD